ncbi:YtpR family tRNA-binding protein [Spiroplasma turonicum]|uniref:Putative tRNA-binding protein n=1 Tax=Spiroplasma turonicum TaxID=216946 RepID=A0A0K1P534_9MOLU|nr:hypothetical protein [Spiroplasma turonicum]AKU79393.1 putative tRNA-binding protein [Spiroplasma turonicum]ALX70414.1 putative tRNA-binding protein [Spiroplasma turonicum]
MKIFLNYVKNFSCIIVTLSDSVVSKTENEDNISLLYNEKELVGINIFNVNLDDYQNKLEDKNLINVVNNELEKINIKLTFENQFIIAKVGRLESIPNTHLSLCKVDNGSEWLQVVCGAKNVREGMFVALATVGSWLPNGIQLKKSQIAGFDSYGMLCSKKELNIKNDNINDIGIMDLNTSESMLGESLWKIL